MQSPASTYMLLDAGTYFMWPTDATAGTYTWYYVPGIGEAGGDCSAMDSTSSHYSVTHADCMSGRHFGGVNMTFADGHAKWLKSNILVKEGTKCDGDKTCTTHVSAWNPLLDNS